MGKMTLAEYREQVRLERLRINTNTDDVCYQLIKKYPSHEYCLSLLFDLKERSDGVKCTYCNSTNININNMKALRCRTCMLGFSLTQNTVLHRTMTKFNVWFIMFEVLLKDINLADTSKMRLATNLNVNPATINHIINTAKSCQIEKFTPHNIENFLIQILNTKVKKDEESKNVFKEEERYSGVNSKFVTLSNLKKIYKKKIDYKINKLMKNVFDYLPLGESFQSKQSIAKHFGKGFTEVGRAFNLLMVKGMVTHRPISWKRCSIAVQANSMFKTGGTGTLVNKLTDKYCEAD